MALKPRGLLALAGLSALALAITAGTLMAAETQPQQQQAAKPVAKIKIVPVAANPDDPNVVVATLADGKTKVQMGATGLPNVSIGAPVTLQGAATDPKVSVTKYAWTLTKPSESKAALSTSNEPLVKFTPDVSGMYKVDLVLTNEAGASPMASVQIRAGEFIGTGAGNCFQCHPKTTHEWSKTGHAKIFKEEINGGADPANSHYAERCVRCHTTGYNPGVDNGGFADIQSEVGWTFPALQAIQTGKGQWEAVPEALTNMANIQCEDCHGPAKDHVLKGAKMAASLDEGVCNVCHNGGGHHVKGAMFENAKHGETDSQAWTYPTGPSRQACVRCHSGAGYISFINNPKEPASWDNSAQTATCAVCHEPHSDANKFQLRITGVPVEAVGITKDFGLSATCVECHNARTKAEDAQKGSFPHYSAAGEMLSGVGGVTYGQNVPNSFHNMVVGNAPVKNAEGADLFGGATPGACVACHMWPTPEDAKDPNRFKVGDHSFNMVSPDGKFEYTEACQSCHKGMEDFNLTAKADYDGNGQAQGVQEEVKGLLTTLQKAIGDSGVKPVEGHPYFDRADVAKANEKQKNAIYNYLFVRGLEGSDGKANAVHNFKRSVALLQLSYKDLTGKDVPSATLMK
ncbi:MAG: multiheme c-type cytochrome [Chloroflexota bacterium]